MVAHPATHPPGTLIELLKGLDLVERAACADDSLIDDLVACGQELVRRGAAAVATQLRLLQRVPARDGSTVAGAGVHLAHAAAAIRPRIVTASEEGAGRCRGG